MDIKFSHRFISLKSKTEQCSYLFVPTAFRRLSRQQAHSQLCPFTSADSHSARAVTLFALFSWAPHSDSRLNVWLPPAIKNGITKWGSLVLRVYQNHALVSSSKIVAGMLKIECGISVYGLITNITIYDSMVTKRGDFTLRGKNSRWRPFKKGQCLFALYSDGSKMGRH